MSGNDMMVEVDDWTEIDKLIDTAIR